MRFLKRNKSMKRNRLIKRKKSTKRNYKKKNLKGGNLYKAFSRKELGNFSRSGVVRHGTDCAPSSLALLNVPKYVIDQLQVCSRHGGMSAEFIVQVLNRVYSNYVHQFVPYNIDTINAPHNVLPILEKIWNLIPNGYGTLGGISRRSGTKHALVFAKIEGIPFILCAQTRTQFEGAGVYQYLQAHDVIEIFVLMSQPRPGLRTPVPQHRFNLRVGASAGGTDGLFDLNAPGYGADYGNGIYFR